MYRPAQSDRSKGPGGQTVDSYHGAGPDRRSRGYLAALIATAGLIGFTVGVAAGVLIVRGF